MAHSRLEKIGTIYSRITGLIKTGAMKLEDRPLWYEVYQAFPPEQEPCFDRPVDNTAIKSIFYPEDVVRANFYKKAKYLPSVNLLNRKDPTLSQKCIELCFQIQKEQRISLNEAFDKAFERLSVELSEGIQSSSRADTSSAVKIPDIQSVLKDSGP
ncbi:mitochondrial ribosomal protein S23 isoform X2 [Rhodnius prolixus]|uniref:Small ribosomal subunit protein mS23 n=2 Tax=Rhodnius TaxID=13248 RepID=A0A4P6D7B1_RHOPR